MFTEGWSRDQLLQKAYISGHPVLRWLQPHRTLERGAFIANSSTPGKNDWNKLGSPLQTLYVKDSPSPAYTQLREMTVSICLPLY